jgi:hypothetical protein
MESIVSVVVGLGSAACSLVTLLAFAVGGFFVLRKLGGGGAGAGFGTLGAAPDVAGLQAMYTDTLGYVSRDTGRPTTTHMVRTVDGHEIHLETTTERVATGTRVSYVWTTPSPSAHRLHVVERRVAEGLRGALKDEAMGRERGFQPAWPTHFPTGDPELDRRFRVYAPTAAHAAAARALKAELLALTHVELQADEQGVRLSDPFQENLLAAMGGPMGMARVATAQGIAAQVTLHEAAAALVVGALS